MSGKATGTLSEGGDLTGTRFRSLTRRAHGSDLPNYG